MASLLAYLDASDLELTPGSVLPIEHYLTEDNKFSPLVDGGALYLVTEAATKLWLVAVLEAPERSQIRRGDQRPHGWYAFPNVVPVLDITPLRRSLALGRRGKLAGTLEEPIGIKPAAEQELRALFDAVDEPVITAVAKPQRLVVDAELPPLERAPALLAAGEIAGGIAALLEAWRELRDVALAELIDRATHLLPRFDHPLADGQDAWFAAWHHEREDCMPQLMRNLYADRRGLLQRLELVASAPEDPRFARQLARKVHAGVHQDEARLYRTIVERSRDARAWSEIAGVIGELDRDRHPGFIESLAFTAQAPSYTTITPQQVYAVAGALARLEDACAEPTLVDAIVEHPDDEQPYLVYADWLLERAHPRGEYIALQCQKQRGALSSASARRLAALEDLPYLYGPLDEIATSTRRARARGVDHTLDVYCTATPLTWRDVARYPLARALTKLRFIGVEKRGRAEAIAMVANALPHLHTIEDISDAFARSLLSRVSDWKGHDASIVRTTRGARPPRPSRARGTSARS